MAVNEHHLVDTMIRNQAFSNPEIEFRVANTYGETVHNQHTTVVDLLEIYPDEISWKPKLDHSHLLHHFRDWQICSAERDSGANPGGGCVGQRQNPGFANFAHSFVEDLNFPVANSHTQDTSSDVNTTAYWLRQRFGVSPLFFSCITVSTYVVKIGNANLVRRENGRYVSLDGLYRFSSGLSCPPVHVWFSHSLINGQSSTYIIHRCPENAKNTILSYVQKKNIPMLLRPLAIDAFLAEDSLNEWGQDVIHARERLLGYENSRISLYSPTQIAEAVEILHSLSQLLQIIREDLTDLQERLDYFKKVHQRFKDLSGPLANDEDLDSVPDSVDFLISKTNILRRWVTNYTERTGIRINLFFNISTQTDSRINLDIARLTSKIAVSTQRDSSSMITMAAVTMFFLPGTFVSALFSMVFFDTQGNSLSVGPQWWLFPVITIPLTIAVFVAWVLWQRRRNRKDLQSLGISRSTELISFDEKDHSRDK
ncbi:hypothetical protein CVT25_006930 [Psilocybe cyanescens]|uniref:Uncharacterized protein n=1 Tax=Psilocybe cyanescens TaxID=93625 RepID=A0A409X627_PSICY|nr:hypothetical protein CVT25_006930 [Psilocybe cyanescens]